MTTNWNDVLWSR